MLATHTKCGRRRWATFRNWKDRSHTVANALVTQTKSTWNVASRHNHLTPPAIPDLSRDTTKDVLTVVSWPCCSVRNRRTDTRRFYRHRLKDISTVKSSTSQSLLKSYRTSHAILSRDETVAYRRGFRVGPCPDGRRSGSLRQTLYRSEYCSKLPNEEVRPQGGRPKRRATPAIFSTLARPACVTPPTLASCSRFRPVVPFHTCSNASEASFWPATDRGQLPDNTHTHTVHLMCLPFTPVDMLVIHPLWSWPPQTAPG